ncbi:hypothetical protein [Acinetobacter gandensis]|uniref:hypothetical protein n=1 Tax=Acinetobacter gandensis TaxID=1443941 RepID=UPI003F564CE0
MENKFFEGLSSKIDRIVDYLATKTDLEIGKIFTQPLANSPIIDNEVYGAQIKKSFNNIKVKDEYLRKGLSTLTQEQKSYFLSISSNEQDFMRSHLRAISAYIEELSDLYESDGSVSLLHNIDIAIKNSYESFVHFVQLSVLSLDVLSQKISGDLNPAFKEKNEQVNTLINELKLYKGEASARKTKEIYKQKYVDYKKTVEVYELYIMLLVCLSVTLVLGQLFAHNFFDALNISNALMIKLTILALIATLFTYCFKQISFYRKISEQAHQTYMELEALPEFLTHLPEDKQHEIRADLAKRYFDQNLFDAIKEDSISIQEQAKANAEVLKSTSALLDVIKKQNP